MNWLTPAPADLRVLWGGSSQNDEGAKGVIEGRLSESVFNSKVIWKVMQVFFSSGNKWRKTLTWNFVQEYFFSFTFQHNYLIFLNIYHNDVLPLHFAVVPITFLTIEKLFNFAKHFDMCIKPFPLWMSFYCWKCMYVAAYENIPYS